MRKLVIGVLIALAVLLGIGWFTMDNDMRRLASNLPTNRDVLFWTVPQRDAAFRTMDRLPVLAETRVIEAGDDVRMLPKGAPFKADLGIDGFVKAQRTAGIVILQDGKIRLEHYGLGFSGDGRWTSFSVAKSFTSTLVGAAIKDGFIKSLDDKVTQYIPELRGSAYDAVTIEQLLKMSSGLRWNEDYEDPKSDVALFNEHKAEAGVDVTVSYLRKLPSAAPPGTKWNYNTGETNLIGVLVSKAVGKPVAQYLSEKVWKPFGMEQDASWLLGATGHEISGCCMQAATRDFARFGQFVLEGGKGVVPEGWFAKATTKQADIGAPGYGYGYQWWTYDDGSVAAQGIFGQGIFIDPKRKLVIASNSNWPKATDAKIEQQREEFYRKVQAAIDAEAGK